MTLQFSLIVPVYNRPDEIRELFQSLREQTYSKPYEIVLVEDGSENSSELVVREFESELTIKYFKKENSGPGDSRNYGMRRANGNYFLLVDSDCILPPDYLSNVESGLQTEFADCFGGPDNDHPSFTTLQKAINYSMTSFFTTGGIRGKKSSVTNFQPRSFNMGLSKEAFEQSGGFGNIHPGEDPDLSLRLKKMGFKIRLIENAVVFHKRRIDFTSFYRQVRKFGMCRPILNKWHKGSASIFYWFPSLFILGYLALLLLWAISGIWEPLLLYELYFLLVFIDAWRQSGSLSVGICAVLAVVVQFTGYGLGFLKSIILVNFSKKNPRQLFPELFFEPASL